MGPTYVLHLLQVVVIFSQTGEVKISFVVSAEEEQKLMRQIVKPDESKYAPTLIASIKSTILKYHVCILPNRHTLDVN